MNRIGNLVAKGELADHEQVVLFSTVFSHALTILTQNALNLSLPFLGLFKAAYQVNSLKNDTGKFYLSYRIEVISLI